MPAVSFSLCFHAFICKNILCKYFQQTPIPVEIYNIFHTVHDFLPGIIMFSQKFICLPAQLLIKKQRRLKTGLVIFTQAVRKRFSASFISPASAIVISF